MHVPELKAGCCPQVKGHLDYMRQMDTILVAVGVPSKEVSGTFFSLQSQAVAVQAGAAGISGQAEKSRHTTEEAAHGWDIPDISDLLDSLNGPEKEYSENTLPLSSQEETTLNGRSTEEDEPENTETEHVSWSWDDTQWTTEHTLEQKRPNLWKSMSVDQLLPCQLFSVSFSVLGRRKKQIIPS